MVRVVALLLREYLGTPARGVVRGATVESSTWCYRLLGVEGLRCLACESAVEALVVKLGFYARRRCSAAGDVFAQRARAMCEARARGVASLRQLLQRGIAFAVYTPPRARKLQRFCAVRGLLVSVVHLREFYMSADAGASSMRAAKAVNLSAEAATREW